MGGRKRRNTAKTGDVALYKSRDGAGAGSTKSNDEDNMYNEVERYHNAKDDLQDDMLKFNSNDQNSDDDEDDENGLTRQENVFDLALGDDDDDSDDDDDDDSDDRYAEKKQKMKIRSSTNYSESDSDGHTPDSDVIYDDDDDDDDDSSHGFEIPETDVLNWGKRKKDYYHGDTADLELGQEVEDAELEEEAGREVLETRMKGMTEDDFMIDDDDDDDSDAGGSDSKKRKGATTSLTSAMNAKMQKNLSKLSKREKIKLMQKTHPELLPLITHFREEFIRPCADETLVVTNAMFQSKENAEAIGATKAGLQYLVTKAMLQTSTALNVCQYLLIKAEKAKLSSNSNNTSADGDGDDNDSSNNFNDSFFIDDQNENNIKNHPVIARLNEFNYLGNKIESDIESKVEGLKEQVEKLVQASSLMAGDEDEDESDEDHAKQPSSSAHDNLSTSESLDLDDPSQNENDDDDSSASSSSGYDDDDLQIQKRNVMNEARFSLRTQDDVHLSLSGNDHNADGDQISRKSKRRRRALPTFTDYGDDEDVDPTILNKASMSLASTINTISQRGKRVATSSAPEVDEDENEERFKRGLEMMEQDLGADFDDDDEDEDSGDIEMDNDDDDDDFYSQIKKKSKAKKELKKSMYAVAPKYPGMDDEIEGERAVGQMIMKNRGLVAHKSKINRNPRVKKREQYRKAVIRRKGAVREVRTDEGHRYGGEQTGIKSGLSRSRKL
mmetsp:Transcript_6003/g.9014  ORF Transcript_6003/g.9014 Transcript_6003/m.9014 type:complete len:725 (+) Transcript_6003:118-2292(+)